MLVFHDICPQLDAKRRRKFRIDSLAQSESFQAMTDMTRMAGSSAADRMLKFAGESALPTTRLIEQAIYARPTLEIPISEKHYLEFRAQFLDEMQVVFKELDGIQRDVIHKFRDQVEAGQHCRPENREKALERLQTVENGEPCEEQAVVWRKLVRFVLTKALESEEETSARFADILEQARRLQDPVAHDVQTRGIRMLEDDGESLTPEYQDCIRRNFDVREVDAFLDRLMERFVQVYDVPPIQVVSNADLETMGGIDTCITGAALAPEETADADAADDVPETWQQYAGFRLARDSQNLFEKWATIGWVMINLVNRKECVRNLQREAENVYLGVMDNTFKMIYNKVRHLLDREERRAFRLLYFRQPFLGYRVAVIDPVLLSFFTGMDEETQVLVFRVLVLADTAVGEAESCAGELERRWRAFLRLYPYWVSIIREEDATRKRTRTASGKTVSIDRSANTGEDGSPLPFAKILTDPKDSRPDLLRSLVSGQTGQLQEWTRRFCTETQTRHIIRRAVGETETQIARSERISQPAVSKNIRKGLQRIRDGLAREGLLIAE